MSYEKRGQEQAPKVDRPKRAEDPPPVPEPEMAIPLMDVKPNTRTVINVQRDRRTIT